MILADPYSTLTAGPEAANPLHSLRLDRIQMQDHSPADPVHSPLGTCPDISIGALANRPHSIAQQSVAHRVSPRILRLQANEAEIVPQPEVAIEIRLDAD